MNFWIVSPGRRAYRVCAVYVELGSEVRSRSSVQSFYFLNEEAAI